MLYSITEGFSIVKKAALLFAGSCAIAAPVLIGGLLTGTAVAQSSPDTGGRATQRINWLSMNSGESPRWKVTAVHVVAGATVSDPIRAENVRLSHGKASIRADRAEAVNTFATTGGGPIVNWKFEGNVRVEFLEGVLEARELTAQTSGFDLTISTPDGRLRVSALTGFPGGTNEASGNVTLKFVATKDNVSLAHQIATVGPAIRNDSVKTQ